MLSIEVPGGAVLTVPHELVVPPHELDLAITSLHRLYDNMLEDAGFQHSRQVVGAMGVEGPIYPEDVLACQKFGLVSAIIRGLDVQQRTQEGSARLRGSAAPLTKWIVGQALSRRLRAKALAMGESLQHPAVLTPSEFEMHVADFPEAVVINMPAYRRWRLLD